MPEDITPENLLHNFMETLSDGISRHKSGSSLRKETPNLVTSKFNKLFGRQTPVHHILGRGKSTDVLLWRNKKISASGYTAVWVLFEWLNYHFLQLSCFALVIGMIGQLVLSNASGILNRSPSKVPRLVLPDDLFVHVAILISAELNRGLAFLQDIACGRNIKQFLMGNTFHCYMEIPDIDFHP
ncbi:reticulon-like protein B8 [Apium graveolens]|uniref:reticulon-like protein B8 n=1 Tax=Apium graveolens TaxID=4045 RepID=UPI003D79CF50